MKRISIFTLILTLAVTACQDGLVDQGGLIYDSEMEFNLSLPGARTKVTAEGFEDADKIGLYVTDYVSDALPMPLQFSGNRANNMAVNFDGSVWTPQESIYWGTGKSDVYAYYPYATEILDVNNQYFEVALDQNDKGYESSDFLWAKAEGVQQADGAVNLAMKHIMSKLVVKVVAGDEFVGSLDSDASVLLHSTVAASRIDLETGAVSKDPYSGVKSIKMKNLGLKTYEDESQAVVYEAIVVPQMIESSVPLFEINSKSVSYLIEDMFNFRPAVAYTYTVTLNTSTTAIKVEIGCEIEDWNGSSGGDSGGSDGDGSDEGDDDGIVYTDLSASGTANCYLVSESGNYKFRSVIGNTDGTVGNVKSVEVLWESYGTDQMPNVGDLITSVTYKNGYIRFSTPETFKNGNAVIAAKNSAGTILWSWHIWCAEEGWQEQVYPNNAGTLMDRNLGAISATPGDVGALGLLYQWGRKDPFLGSSDINSSSMALSTGEWIISTGQAYAPNGDYNPMTYYSVYDNPHDFWNIPKAAHDPCPYGWMVPIEENSENVWSRANFAETAFYDSANKGILFDLETSSAWYPATGAIEEQLQNVGVQGSYYTVSCYGGEYGYFGKGLYHSNGTIEPLYDMSPSWIRGAASASVRCQKETTINSENYTTDNPGNEGISEDEGNGAWELLQ